jgi:hypothetical protein
MAWKETRGSSRVALAAARHVAHADDAKARTDEATRLPTRSLRPRVLAGVGASVVVLALVAFLAVRGGAADDETHPAALVESTPSASATPTEPTPADVLEESHPSGVWKLVIVGRTTTTRGGTTTPLKGKGDPVEWTFPAASCSDTQCSGTISSSSGREFPFSWDGRRLDVTRTGLVEHGKKQACVDVETGEPRPIETSADRITYRFSYGPFTGGPGRMTAKATTRISYEWFGDCEPHATDPVRETYAWVLTPIDRT